MVSNVSSETPLSSGFLSISTPVLAVLLLLSIGIIGGWKWTTGSPDPREPPVLLPKVPVIGHMIGIIQHEAEYFQKLCSRAPWPIFTLRIFSARLYVITSPSLVQNVFKNSKTLTFDPIFLNASERIFAIPKDKMKLMSPSSPDSADENTLVRRVEHSMHVSMAAGTSLLQMNARALNRFGEILSPIDSQGKSIDLFSWLRHSFTIASADALYGPVNPILEDPSLIDSLRDFEDSVGLLFLNILPSLTTPKGYRARAALASAFRSYYARGLNSSASDLVKGRASVLQSCGIETLDLAIWEAGLLMGATMNSIPGIFWLLCYVLSSPSLLDEIRSEIATIIIRKGEEVILDVSQLQKNCPLLVSTWQETLRMANATVSNRVVKEDMLLDDMYLLKKGAVIQMPSGTMHSSKEIWGSDADEFNARRFLKPKKKMQKMGFIPFGGGAILCPGRYFATTEILGVAATLFVGYEFQMKDGGDLKLPGMKRQGMSVQVKHPAVDLQVVMKRRQEFEGMKWGFDVGGGEMRQEDLVFEQ